MTSPRKTQQARRATHTKLHGKKSPLPARKYKNRK